MLHVVFMIGTGLKKKKNDSKLQKPSLDILFRGKVVLKKYSSKPHRSPIFKSHLAKGP